TPNDGARGSFQVGGFINDYRRVARTSDNGALRTAQRRSANRRATGDTQQPNLAMSKDRLRGFQRGSGDDREQVIDTDRLVNRLVDQLPPPASNASPAGMRIADKGIAGRKHVDGIPRQRWQGMGNGRDYADDTERSIFDEGNAVLTRIGLRSQKLDARNLLANHDQLLDLVLTPAAPGLLQPHSTTSFTLSHS